MTNCPNCGAAISNELDKCPYCGTLYFDLTAIDFTETKPVWLKMKLTNGKQQIYFTQLCIPKFENMRYEEDYSEIYELNTSRGTTFTTGRNVFVDLIFQSITDSSGQLFEVKVCE